MVPEELADWRRRLDEASSDNERLRILKELDERLKAIERH
jgi:hypothetical protein